MESLQMYIILFLAMGNVATLIMLYVSITELIKLYKNDRRKH